jgi:hypothetical protein
MAGETGVTRTTELNELVKRAVTAARFTLQGKAFVRNTLTDKQNLPGNTDTSLKVPKLTQVEAFALTEGVDMTQAQRVKDSVVTITPEEVGVQVIITDKQMQTSSEDSRTKIGQVMGNAMAKKMERDTMALFSGFDTDLGSAAAGFDHDDIGRGRSNIRGSTVEPNDGRTVCVLHPHHSFDIYQDLTEDPQAGTDTSVSSIPSGMSQDIYREHHLGKLHGTDLFESSLMAVDASDDAVAAVYTPDALITVDFKPPALRPERDESRRAVELNLVSDYGQSEYSGIWGFAITADASAQT